MRKELTEIENVRNIFIGTFERFGIKNGWKTTEKTILLKDILDKNNKIVAGHLWFNYTKCFAKLNLKEGDKVQFCARVKEYEKGYKGYRDDIFKPIEIDYRLSHPTKILKVI